MIFFPEHGVIGMCIHYNNMANCPECNGDFPPVQKKPKCKKVKYSTKQFAESDIKRISRYSKRSLKPVGAYYCDECFAWHLTSRHSSTLQDLQTENAALRKEIKKLECKIKELTNHVATLKKKPT